MGSWGECSVKSVGAEAERQTKAFNIVVSQTIVIMSYRRLFRRCGRDLHGTRQFSKFG